METISRPFPAGLRAEVSKPDFGGAGVSDCVAASIKALPLGEPVECPPVSRSGKSERSALGPPVKRQAGVGHELVRSEIGGLFAVEDRCDDIRRQMV